MDRRLALKQLAIFTGGVIMIPSCDFSEKSVLEAYDKLQITEEEKTLLTKMVKTILPGEQLKSAEEIHIQDFVLVMANDCLSEEDQKNYLQGWRKTDSLAKKQKGTVLEKLDQNEAEDFLLYCMNMDVEKEKDQGHDFAELNEVKHFVNTTKRFTLQGYMTSEYYMTEVMPYSLVPGGFKGEKLIDEPKRINTNG